jgi:uncharacterized coiled-coil protein SlyX
VFGLRTYRELIERLDGTLAGLDVRIAENSGVIAENSRVIAGNMGAVDDMRDQIRANTEAILRMLDRLDGNGNENPA